MKTLSIFLFSLFSLLAIRAQDDYQAMDWGQIPAEDLQMTTYAPDTLAQAIVLGDQGYMDVSTSNSGQYEWFLRRHKRVKILSESAIKDQGDVVIYYMHKDGRDQLRRVQAQTIATDGTITTIDKEEVYIEKINEYWSKASFSFPEVTVGSILEYRYEHFSKRVLSPNPWVFRGSLPVRSSYFKFACSAPITYTYLLQGAEFMTAEKTSTGEELLRLGDTKIHVDGAQFWLQNGGAVEKEPYMTALDDYYINVRFQASATISSTGFSTSVYGTWEETNQDLLSDEDLGLLFKRKNKYKKLLEAANTVIDASASQEEILYDINRFITKEIRWNEKYGIWAKQSPNDAFSTHQASLPEIQYAALALLREYGIKAYPVLLSTRNNGAMIQSFPFLDQFNYVVIIVEIENLARLVDFSDPYLKPGTIRPEALNGYGFMLHEENPAWITLGISTVQDIMAWNAKITADGNLEGEMKTTMNTISARAERLQMNTKSLGEIWTSRLPNGNNWSELAVDNEEDIRQPLTIKGKFMIPEAGFTNDDFLYVSPVIYTGFITNPFKREKRDYPVDFPYSFEEKSIYQYELPEGYTVESLPKNSTLVLPNNDAIFQYMARETNGKISILIVLKVVKTLYPPEEYSALRDLFAEAAQKMQEQIVLRKTN